MLVLGTYRCGGAGGDEEVFFSVAFGLGTGPSDPGRVFVTRHLWFCVEVVGFAENRRLATRPASTNCFHLATIRGAMFMDCDAHVDDHCTFDHTGGGATPLNKGRFFCPADADGPPLKNWSSAFRGTGYLTSDL